MADRFIVEHVGRLPMFSPLPPELLEALAEAFITTRYERGELIFQQNDSSKGLYLLVSGRGALWQYNGSTMQQIALIEPNQYINEAALIREGSETATFQVIETAIVLFLSRVNFHATLQRFPAMRSYIALPLGQIALGSAPNTPGLVSANSPLGQQRLTPSSLVNAPNTAPQGGQINQAHPQQSYPQNQPNQPDQRQPNPQLQQPSTASTNYTANAPQTPYATGTSASAARLLRSGEHLLLQTRRHWWAYIRQSWIPIVAGVIMLLVAFSLPADELRLLLLAGTLLVPGALVLYFYLEWRNDQLIITTDRVLRIENTIITFQSWVNEVPIRSIQQVNTEIPPWDVFARIFNYGEVVLKTAGKTGTVKLNFIPDAERVQDMIFELLNSKQQDQVERRDDQIRDDMQRILGNLPPERAKTTPATRSTERGFLQTRFINASGATVYRKHWLFWLRGILVPALIMLGAVGAVLLFLVVPGLNTIGVVAYPAAALAFVVGGLWFFWADWDWRNDVYIIGDDTISIIHRRPLWLQNEDDRILISRIDNVIVEISGILRSAFNYGDVKLSLIGDTGTKIFSDVPNPRAVQGEISGRQTRLRQATVEAENNKRRDEIAKYIAAYDEARGFANNPNMQGGPAGQNAHPTIQNQSAPPNLNQIPRAAPTANPRYGTGIPNSRPDPLNLPNSSQGRAGRRPPNNRR
jgi:membrane protein YdbS with pleckstrin-like domain